MKPLSPQPTQSPQFSVTAKLRNGTEIKLADPCATRALVSLMDMHAVLGGAASHFGGPAALAELMSALHGLVFASANQKGRPYFELFNLVNDAGHCENGLYALKANYGWAGVTFDELKTFRALDSRLTGHGEAHLFPEGVLLSNGPLGSSLAQAQGLSMADRLKGVARTTVVTISDGACMEGEAREALASIPGLAAREKLAPFVLLISDNNTKLSGRIDKDAFSMTPTFESLKALGWKVLDLPQGNNLQACVETLEQALELAHKNPQQPVAIHARTVKGFGVRKTTEAASGGHGFPLKGPQELKEFIAEIFSPRETPQFFVQWTNELIQSVEQKKPSKASVFTPPEFWGKADKIQVGVAKAMIEARKKGLPIVSVTSDLPGSTGVAEFHKAFPQDSFDVGVAEANMVSVASGFSKGGFIPVVDTFAQFGVTKGALPLIMGNLSLAPVIAVFSHTGFQDAADGASHQALGYAAMVATIPHTQAIALTCNEEAFALMTQAFEKFQAARAKGEVPEQYVFFLGRENFPARYQENANYHLGQAQVFSASAGTSRLCIAAFGSMLREALIAQNLLAKDGIFVDVINPSSLNKVDLATVLPVLKKSSHCLLTLEDHQIIGGAGGVFVQAVAEALTAQKQQLQWVKSLGVRHEFGQSAYTAQDLYAKHGIDAASVVRLVREAF